MTVRALLWDADGVLQHGPIGWNWRQELDRVGGRGFSKAVFVAEKPALRGEQRLRDALAAVLRAWPHVPLTVDDLLGLWEMASIDPEAFSFVTELRDRGIPCHLASNQQDHRRAWMRDSWGYDEHFDRVYYSSDLGVAKPDPQFFELILDDLGLSAGDVGFIDDSVPNVEAARAVGIRSFQYEPRSGIVALRAGVEELLSDDGR